MTSIRKRFTILSKKTMVGPEMASTAAFRLNGQPEQKTNLIDDRKRSTRIAFYRRAKNFGRIPQQSEKPARITMEIGDQNDGFTLQYRPPSGPTALVSADRRRPA